MLQKVKEKSFLKKDKRKIVQKLKRKRKNRGNKKIAE